ncbi:C-terminal binding protein [Auraticoccus sp. F435]|uniref:C-terminal binding protein n=1 Tax=Auraticoccus cholistanensis TaxID=2656650 RepID=A0A6A9URK4_9ACTN|nr:C-terminal binding protein [Auraticoccus cholistanensis]MVA75188.1 C-terminal binding protein [Auraticoccus cholistanensis]
MNRLVVTDHIFAGLEQEQATAATLGLELSAHQISTEAEAREVLAGVRLALVNFAPVTRPVLSAMAPGATVVRYGIGYDNIDTEAARELGVTVCNVPDYGSATVADHAVTLLLVLLRKVVRYDRAIAAGQWPAPPDLAPVHAFAATTVGLLGTGRIGREVARRLAPFGFTVLAADPVADAEELARDGIELVDTATLFERSDALSLHAPLTPATRHVVGAENLARMPAGAVVVNTARGGLVDTDAVLAALESGRLGGVALDVVEPEPLPVDHPLRDHPHALLTPHAAFYSEESLHDLQRLACEEILRAGRGEPPRCPVT